MSRTTVNEKVILFCLVILPLIFLPNQGVFDYYYFPRHFLLLICSVILIINAALHWKDLKREFVLDKISIALLIFFGISAISIFFADNPYLAFQGNDIKYDGFITLFFYVLLFFTARTCKNIGNKAFYAMLGSASIIAIYGIAQFYGFDPFILEIDRFPNVPYTTIGNQNFVGTYLVLMLPFSIHYWLSERNNIAILSYILLFYCLLTTMSRGPWLGFIISITLYFVILLVRKSLKLRQFALFLFVTIVVLLFFTAVSEKSVLARFLLIFFDFELIINNPNSAVPGSFRWFIWRKVVELIKERPVFGFGFANLGYAFEERFSLEILDVFKRTMFIDEAHNEFLDIAVSTGIPSLIAYLAFLWFSFYKLLKTYFERINYNTAIIAAVFGYLIQSFFNISIVSVAYLFWILLGLFAQRTSDSHH